MARSKTASAVQEGSRCAPADSESDPGAALDQSRTEVTDTVFITRHTPGGGEVGYDPKLLEIELYMGATERIARWKRDTRKVLHLVEQARDLERTRALTMAVVRLQPLTLQDSWSYDTRNQPDIKIVLEAVRVNYIEEGADGPLVFYDFPMPSAAEKYHDRTGAEFSYRFRGVYLGEDPDPHHMSPRLMPVTLQSPLTVTDIQGSLQRGDVVRLECRVKMLAFVAGESEEVLIECL